MPPNRFAKQIKGHLITASRFQPSPVDEDILILALVKRNGERYLIFYTHKTRAESLRTLGRWASNPELSFDWDDATELSQKVRKVKAK